MVFYKLVRNKTPNATITPYETTAGTCPNKNILFVISFIMALLKLNNYGGGDRIRTCDTLQYDGLAIRCLQPLGHASVFVGISQKFSRKLPYFFTTQPG